MSVIYRISDALHELLETYAELQSSGALRVFVQQNLVPTPDALGLYMAEYTGSFELRKLTVKYSRTPASGVVQDAAMTTHHFLNLTAGLPDASWTNADYTAVESAFDAFWTTIKVKYAPSLALSEYNWRADGPAFKPFGTSLAPTLRATARSVAGTGTGESLPPQTAVSVTETTDAKFTVLNVEGVGTQVRNRWGRFFMPPPTVGQVSNGRLGSGSADNFADAVETCYEACTAAGLIPVMYSPTTGHAWSILEIHVDDILDVIRSRRFITPLSRHARVLTQP